MTGQIILLIEDNPLNLELAHDVLQAAGYTVLEARTAEEGLKLAGATTPDLILLDIRLPGMNGLDAARRLKGDLSTRNIPVVALTAQAMRGDEEVALAAGFNGYITKPINTRTLAAEVRRWLESPDPARERRSGT
jgi:two-component system cell cycle response regulator DivK